MGLTGIGTNCAAFTTTGAATEKLSANPIANTVTPGAFPFTVELDDTGNVTTPSSVASATSATKATSLQIIAGLAVNSNLTTTLPDAVINRPYGTGAGCSGGGCTPVAFTASNGISPYTYNAITNSDSAGVDLWPTGFACVPAAAVDTCSAATVALTVNPGPFAPGVTVNDTGNYATPSGLLDTPTTLNVDSQVTLKATISALDYSASAWPVGALNRSLRNGDRMYRWRVLFTCDLHRIQWSCGWLFVLQLRLADRNGLSPCTPATPTLTCSTTNLTAGVGAYSPSVTATDTANATTPAATTTTDPTSVLTSTNDLTVNPELAILTPYLENAVVGEPYRATLDSGAAGGPACTSLALANCAGVGAPYTWSATTGGIAGVSFVTPAPVPTDDTSANIRGYYQGTPTTSGNSATAIQVADGGNATTPSCSTPATCPLLSLVTNSVNAPKVFASQGFVAEPPTNTLLPFDTNTFTAAPHGRFGRDSTTHISTSYARWKLGFMCFG